jgi:hypothetical protein
MPSPHPNVKEEKGDTITIRGQQIPVRTTELEQTRLRFYPDNPRIYALIHHDNQAPPQEYIETLLLATEHVRELILDIKTNGGLMEPLLVRDGTLEVLEGNSRLAAYRGLARQDPIAWGHVKCTLLPRDLEESLVFALLGQYHVKGRKAWQPFEQAGFLYRRCRSHKLDYKTLGTEIGLKWKTVKHLIETYQFMLDHHEPPERWSYYDEYLKSSKIARARENQPNLDGVVVKKIKSVEIVKAVAVRDELPQICITPRVLQKFVTGKLGFEAASAQARDAGADNVPYRRLVRFREFIVDPSVELSLLGSEPAMRDRCHYELEKIEARIKRLKSKLKPK